MPLAEITTGLAALKGAYEIAKGLKDIDDQVRLNSAIMELQSKIIEAQNSALDSRAAMEELSARLAEYQRWESVASRYKLKDFGQKTFAYEYSPEDGDETPLHLACTNCFQKRQLSILQFRNQGSGREYFTCPACSTVFALGTYRDDPPPRINRKSSDWLA